MVAKHGYSGRTAGDMLSKKKSGGAAKAKKTPNKGTSEKNGGLPFPRFPYGKYNLDLNHPGILNMIEKASRRAIRRI